MKNDGAVLLLIMEKEYGIRIQFQHGLLFKDECGHIEYNFPGIGPVPAISNLLKRNQLTIENIEVIEINEAFSARVTYLPTSFKYSKSQLNIWGGALASGHPYGASGARISDSIILYV